ncbi:hypothetical protein CR513_42120, partial [Mucuna pruriens]
MRFVTIVIENLMRIKCSTPTISRENSQMLTKKMISNKPKRYLELQTSKLNNLGGLSRSDLGQKSQASQPNSLIRSGLSARPRRQSSLGATSSPRPAQLPRHFWRSLQRKLRKSRIGNSLCNSGSLAFIFSPFHISILSCSSSTFYGGAQCFHWCFSRLRKCRLGTEKSKIARGDRLDYQRTLVDLILSVLARSGEPSSFDPCIVRGISPFSLDNMANNDRTLKEWATLDIMYRGNTQQFGIRGSPM